MRLSVIIVNYKTWDDLAANLEPLSDGFIAGGKHEVIVVDNASGGDGLERMRKSFSGVTFAENQGNYGFAHACNLGARMARGEMLLFVNPDLRAEPEQIESLLDEKQANEDITILSAAQTDGSGRPQKAFDVFPGPFTSVRWIRGLAKLFDPASYPDARKDPRSLAYCDWVSGSLLLISRRDFQRLGGWNADYWMYMEDVDLCRRARDLGMKVACTKVRTFVHHHGAASRANDDIAAVTKSERTISQHVYVNRHYRGIERGIYHLVTISRVMPPLALYSLANLLSLGRIRSFRVKTRVMWLLSRYYMRALGRGEWRSDRIDPERLATQ